MSVKKNGNIIKLKPIFYAYIGDSVYELYIRQYILNKYFDKLKLEQIHKETTKYVCAKAQSKMIENLIDDNILSEEETEIYKSGRNAHSKSKSKNSSVIEYRKATGFECLIGYLYCENELNRLDELINICLKYEI